MVDDDKAKPNISAGLNALKSPHAQADDNASKYPQSPNPGNIVAPCKNKECTSAIDFGFVIDMATWIENFEPQELTCQNPNCKLKTLYFRRDLVPVPAGP
jgi:hypothetical protein